jgi:hypothetical protein
MVDKLPFCLRLPLLFVIQRPLLNVMHILHSLNSLFKRLASLPFLSEDISNLFMRLSMPLNTKLRI